MHESPSLGLHGRGRLARPRGASSYNRTTLAGFLSLVVSILLVGIPGTVLALDDSKRLTQYTLESWGTDQGFPVNSVSCVVQTSDGFLWVGTQGGLVRFDGLSCRVFDRRNSPDLPTSIIRSLLATRNGDLWIGLEAGGVVVYRRNRLSRVLVDELGSATITALHEDLDDTIWIGTDDGRLVTFDKGGLQPAGDRAELGGNIGDMLTDPSGTTWVAVEGTGVWGYHLDGSVTNLTTAQGLPNNSALSLGLTADGVFWIGTHSGGLVRIEGSRVSVLRGEDGLPDETVQSLVEDGDRNFWIATQQGLCRLTDRQSRPEIDCRLDFGTNDIQSLFEGREGSLWVGTRGDGLCRLKDSPVVTFGKREGLESDQTWTVMEDSRGHLWVGTSGGGLYRLQGNQVDPAYSTSNGLTHDTVLSLSEDDDGSLWVGTRHGLNRIVGGEVTQFVEGEQLTDDFVRVLSKDPTGRIWMGTRSGVVIIEDGRFSEFSTKADTPIRLVRHIFHAADGSVWIGTDGDGLVHCLDSDCETLTTEDGLSSGFVYSVLEDNKGTLWVGTNEGLNRIRGDRIDVLTRDQGLPDDWIYAILDDGSSQLWMSTNGGVIAAPLDALDRAMDSGGPVEGLRTFDAADGMATKECNGGVQPAGWKDAAGGLWFPTGRGVVRIDPAGIRRNTLPPNIVIERLEANPFGVLTAAEESAELPAGTTRFELHYAALSLLNPARARYRYRLDGFENEWTDAGSRRTAYYTNVPPGRYVFRVSGCNKDGVWSPQDATLAIEIRPKFYQTAWALMIAILAAVGMVTAAFVLRTRQARLRERQLMELVKERTKLLEDANRQLEVLANQDGLTGLANRRHFMERYELEWKRACRNQIWISVVFVDIDHFKIYNDAFGHQAGDDCLRRVARVLDASLHRPADLVARYGGEEFVAMLPETDSEGAVTVAELMRQAVLDLEIPHADAIDEDVISVSLGVAGVLPEHDMDSGELLERADRALYRAKKAGRNRTVED